MPRLGVQNFRGIRSLEAQLGQVNIIVGQNACGKSSLLQALDVLLGASSRPSRQGVEQYFSAKHANSLVTQDERECRLFFEDAPTSIAVVLRSVGHGAVERAMGESWQPLILNPERSALTRPVVFDVSARLAPNGEGLADVVADFDDEKRARVVQFVKWANPRVAEILTQRVEVHERVLVEMQDGSEHSASRKRGSGYQLQVRDVGGIRLNADALSDGTLWAIALGAALQHAPATQSVMLLIDDLDRDLHPQAQFEVARALREVVKSNPKLSLVATAHSPFLLNAFEANEVFAMLRSAGTGPSVLRPLSEHPEWKKWSEQLEPGEFWSWKQESWVASGAA